jgi:hypothetical protein
MKLLMRFMLIFVYHITWWHWCTYTYMYIYSPVRSRAYKYNNTTQTMRSLACMRLKLSRILTCLLVFASQEYWPCTGLSTRSMTDTSCLRAVWYGTDQVVRSNVHLEIGSLYERFRVIRVRVMWTVRFTVRRWTNNERERGQKRRRREIISGPVLHAVCFSPLSISN